MRVFGKIGQITRDENENSDEYTYLIFEEGAEIPESENLGDITIQCIIKYIWLKRMIMRGKGHLIKL